MSTTQLPRREPSLHDVIDLRPWDAPAPLSEDKLGDVLTWLDDPTA